MASSAHASLPSPPRPWPGLLPRFAGLHLHLSPIGSLRRAVSTMARGGGYAWALAAGLNAALAAISAKFFAPMLLKYGMVILFNVTMWGCYVNSLKALSSLQATVTNFAANFISSGLAGYFLFQEPLPSKWFAGAGLIIAGVFILSKSSIESEKKLNSD